MNTNGYDFSWEQLGDIQEGRPNLGANTTVAVYRLMQYTLRAVLEKEYGDERTRDLLRQAGRLSGREFYKNIMEADLPFNRFVARLQDTLAELSIGILRMEESNLESMSFVATVSEDLDCSGLPIKGVTVCDYDEGFIEGIFSEYTGKEFDVKEIDCWTTGERICRFAINLRK